MEIKEYYRLKNIKLPQNNDINIIDLIRLLYKYAGNSHKLNNKTEKLKEYIQNKKHIFFILIDGMGSNLINSLDNSSVLKKNKIMENCINKWIELAKNKKFEEIMIDTAEKSYVGKYLEKSKKVSEAMGPLGKNATYDRFIAQAKACENHESYEELHKIEAQTLIIGAGQDKVLGIEGSLELAERIKLSELYIYDEYSHGVYEQAKDFNKRVFEYLKK